MGRPRMLQLNRSTDQKLQLWSELPSLLSVIQQLSAGVTGNPEVSPTAFH